MASSVAAAISSVTVCVGRSSHAASSGTASRTASAPAVHCCATSGSNRGSRATVRAEGAHSATSSAVHQRLRSSTSTTSSVSGHPLPALSCSCSWSWSWSSNGSTVSGKPRRRRVRRMGCPSARRDMAWNSRAMCATASVRSSGTEHCASADDSARDTSRTALACSDRVSWRSACHARPASVSRVRRSTMATRISCGSAGPPATTAGGMAASNGAAASTSAANGCQRATHHDSATWVSTGSTRRRPTICAAVRCSAPNQATDALTPVSASSSPNDASVVASMRWHMTFTRPSGNVNGSTRVDVVYARDGRRAMRATSWCRLPP